MVGFVNIHSVDRIIFSMFNRFNQQWQNRTLNVFTLLHKQLDMTEEFVVVDFRGEIWEDFGGRDSAKTLDLAGLPGIESGR